MIDIKQVQEVYSGKPGCACGCRGKYYTDGKMIEKVVGIINETKPIDICHASDNRFVWIDKLDENGIAKRTYTVYFKREVRP
jgi:hypothetical protein